MRIKIDFDTDPIINKLKNRAKELMIFGYRWPKEFRCSCGAVNEPGVFSCPSCGGLNVNLYDHSYVQAKYDGWEKYTQFGYENLDLEGHIRYWGEQRAREWRKLDGVIKRAKAEDHKQGRLLHRYRRIRVKGGEK